MANSGTVPIKDLLNPQEKKTLENIYTGFGVPTDQLRRCPDILSAIADTFERMESRRIEPTLLLRYMFNRRKQVDWPKLGKRAVKLESLLNLLPATQVAALEKLYIRFNVAVDLYQFRPALMRELSSEFLKATGVNETGAVLVAVMTARRKRGLWPALFEETQAKPATGTGSTGGSFSDIAEVDRMHKRKKAAGE